MTIANVLAGTVCPPVVCQSRGPRYCWHDGVCWRAGHALPPEIYDAQPPDEQARIERHAVARPIHATTARATP